MAVSPSDRSFPADWLDVPAEVVVDDAEAKVIESVDAK